MATSHGQKLLKFVMMLIGSLCAMAVVYAKSNAATPGSLSNSKLGVVLCVCSTFASSSEVIVVRSMGSSAVKLNPVDAILYMAIPNTIVLSIPALLCSHPIPWPDHGHITDREILSKIFHACPSILLPVAFSGVFALMYNILLYSTAQAVQASYVSMASQFNKVATIALATVLGFEKSLAMPWSVVLWFGVGRGQHRIIRILELLAKRKYCCGERPTC
eukprot:gnl/TRDRNA2_/TRDRNA2_174613_c0_seq2.p1 gnl/TRDRNA2_/TRDRNA2_174613_c0~~gnl/TRDRNA2_/TRDRNA2_174613_c0_seq2.p1  ORF type:complete len:218 (+),score=14.12 gnl/TRDRNA2_/TRDRNA2_174613_c0_seq2:121-774(+)